MNLLFLNKALLWKEWRQNRGILIVLFSLLFLVPLCDSVLRWSDIKNSNILLEMPEEWLAEYIFISINNIMSTLGVLTAVILGVLFISQERFSNTLDFLISTPVSRRDIVKTKFFLGVGAISASIFINFLCISFIFIILPTKYNIIDAFLWYLLTTSILLAGFSMSFFISTVTGNWKSTLLASLAVLFSPQFIEEVLTGLLYMYYHSTNRLIEIVEYVAKNLILYNHFVGTNPGRAIGLRILLMLTVTVIFYILSLKLFKKNPMEKNGQVLMFGKFSTVLKFVLPFIVAFIFSLYIVKIFNLGHTGIELLLIYLISLVAVFALIPLVTRLQRHLGFIEKNQL